MTIDDLGVHPPAPLDAPPVEKRTTPAAAAAPAPAGGSHRRRRAVTAATGLALLIGVVARFVAVSPLWLDEALTVNIARLPVGDLLEALRHDGAPPLFYLLLHWWTDLVGSGDVASRALSGLLSVACLPLMWLAGRRLVEGDQSGSDQPGADEPGADLPGTDLPGTDGPGADLPGPGLPRPGLPRTDLPGASGPGRERWVPWAAVLLLASSPFAIRYATEVRMYSLVVLLVLAGYLALDTVLRRRSLTASVVLAAVTGLLFLTHYWAFYLAAAVAALLVVRARDADPARRAGARRALPALAGGTLLFLPWLPSFLEQMTATGTPWGGPPRPRSVFEVVMQFASGLSDTALPLGILLYALVALGLFGAVAAPDRAGRRLVVLDLRGRPPGRMLAAAAGLTVVLAIVVGRIAGSAFAIRYAAVVLPVVLLLAALGTSTLVGTGAGPTVLAVAVVLGFVTAIPHMAGDRTSAGRVAAALRADARPGDVVAYCPDQLGPAVSRLLDEGTAPGLVQVAFPRGHGPELIDWVGYKEANQAAATAPFARMLLDRAGPDRSVWVVWAPGYRTFGTKCQGLLSDLRQARPGERRAVSVSTNTFERPGLVQFPPG